MSAQITLDELMKYLRLVILSSDVDSSKREFSLDILITIERMRLGAPSVGHDASVPSNVNS